VQVVATPDSRVVALAVPGDSEPWKAAGFACSEAGFAAGAVQVLFGRPDGAGTRLVIDPPSGLAGAGLEEEIEVSGEIPDRDHPNGVVGVDHVVISTTAMERARDALLEAGLDLRLEREGRAGNQEVDQAFFLAGPCVVELVGRSGTGDGGSAVWGVTFTTDSLDALPALDPPPVASIRDAVQPGRRIAVARREVGLPTRVAFMNPRPAADTQ
jgi:hypothetical protein